MPIFSMAENAAYQCMENGGGKHAHIDRDCGSLCASSTMLRQSQGHRRVHTQIAECFLSILRHMNGEQRYH